MREFGRKLCSSHALFPWYAAAVAPHTEAVPLLSAVILLNSPSTTAADWEHYLRLWKCYRVERGGGDGLPKRARDPRCCCYFVCGDGAFPKLRRYADAQAAKDPERAGWLRGTALCDAVIGDMDSLPVVHHLRFRNKPDFALNAEQRADIAGGSGLCEDEDGEDDEDVGNEKENGSSGSTAHVAKEAAQRKLLSYLDFHGEMYDSVADIPDALLDEVHRKVCPCSGAQPAHDAAVAPDGNGPGRVLLLPIACQMSTDFDKCVGLVQRLRKRFGNNGADEDEVRSWQPSFIGNAGEPDVGGAAQRTPGSQQWDSHEFISAAEVTTLCVIRQLEEMKRGAASCPSSVSSEDAGAQAADATTCQECDRHMTLLKETSVYFGTACDHPDTGSALSAGRYPLLMRTHVLPQVAVFGALGGRLDHELGAINTLAVFAKEVHLMLVNDSNVVFACWPDGVTTWLPMSPPREAASSPSSSEAEEARAAPENLGSERGKKDRTKGSTAIEGPVCGLVSFGPVAEVETSGFVYDIVKGRNASCPSFTSRPRFDGVTQTEKYTFAFGHLISACNAVKAAVVTVDLRRLAVPADAPAGSLLSNPPTIISCNRAVTV